MWDGVVRNMYGIFADDRSVVNTTDKHELLDRIIDNSFPTICRDIWLKSYVYWDRASH
jgi:hypothetical protein